MARFAFASAIVLLAAFCSAASLTGLGSGTDWGTLAYGVSADGSAVTGVYRTETDEVFRWTPSGGSRDSKPPIPAPSAAGSAGSRSTGSTAWPTTSER